jgi:hypothetical protein
VYVPGQDVSLEAPIAWLDRHGKTSPLRATPALWGDPKFSPDGRRVAMTINDRVKVYEWGRDTLSGLGFDSGDDSKPVWSADGRRIVFASVREKGVANLYWERADGTGSPQRLTQSPNQQRPGSSHPGAKYLAYQELNSQSGWDLMILPLEGDDTSGWKPGTPTVFLNSRFSEQEPMFSPDGRWLAYHSNDTGREEIYVRPFPGPGGKWQVSANGGSFPTWSRARSELFFAAPDRRIMVASYAVEGDSFRPDKPRVWSETPYVPRIRLRSFDLHPDGDRFAAGGGDGLVRHDRPLERRHPTPEEPARARVIGRGPLETVELCSQDCHDACPGGGLFCPGILPFGLQRTGEGTIVLLGEATNEQAGVFQRTRAAH